MFANLFAHFSVNYIKFENFSYLCPEILKRYAYEYTDDAADNSRILLDAARPEGMALRLCSGEFAIRLPGV